MNKYKVYKHPIGDIEAIKKGWSWPAFFLGFIWAFYKKLWPIGFGALVLTLIMYSAFGSSSSTFSFADALSIIMAIIFGANGNEWRNGNLESRGFDYMETVYASSSDGAIAVHLKNDANPSATKEPFL